MLVKEVLHSAIPGCSMQYYFTIEHVAVRHASIHTIITVPLHYALIRVYKIRFCSIMLQPIIPLLSPVYTSCQAPFVFQPSLPAPLSHLGLMELRFTNLPWMWTLLECQTGMTSATTGDHWVYFSWKWSSILYMYIFVSQCSHVAEIF